MKRWFACLLCLLTALTPLHALAEDGPVFEFIYPFEDIEDGGSAAVPDGDDESIRVEYGGQSLRLGFDRSPEYSKADNGMVQASFYAYGSDNSTLYELYMVFPQSAQAGMVFTPDYAAMTGMECSVTFILSTGSSETYYYSGMMDGGVYPAGSDFTLRFDSITETSGGRRFAGSIDATLIALDLSSGQVKDTLTVQNAPFSFTMIAELGASPAKPGEPQRDAPAPTATPKDLRKV